MYNIPPHLKRVDTLPWEILTPERHKQPEVYNVIYDISQGTVAMGFRPAETSDYDFITNLLLSLL